MYEDVLKEKENLGIKLVQGEEEKKKMARENELLGKKLSENGRVCMINVMYIFCRDFCFINFEEFSLKTNAMSSKHLKGFASGLTRHFSLTVFLANIILELTLTLDKHPKCIQWGVQVPVCIMKFLRYYNVDKCRCWLIQ